jgi:hypothetical protein
LLPTPNPSRKEVAGQPLKEHAERNIRTHQGALDDLPDPLKLK